VIFKLIEIIMSNSQNNFNKKEFVLLSIKAALSIWDVDIGPNLRAVSIGWDEHSIDIYFIYDGAISDDDAEISECIATEVVANFPDEPVQTHHIRCDFPKPIPLLGSEVVFARKQP
jgi:hypothetical protein